MVLRGWQQCHPPAFKSTLWPLCLASRTPSFKFLLVTTDWELNVTQQSKCTDIFGYFCLKFFNIWEKQKQVTCQFSGQGVSISGEHADVNTSIPTPLKTRVWCYDFEEMAGFHPNQLVSHHVLWPNEQIMASINITIRAREDFLTGEFVIFKPIYSPLCDQY